MEKWHDCALEPFMEHPHCSVQMEAKDDFLEMLTAQFNSVHSRQSSSNDDQFRQTFTDIVQCSAS